jgi:hypothetical protein
MRDTPSFCRRFANVVRHSPADLFVTPDVGYVGNRLEKPSPQVAKYERVFM